ncbi:MAG: VOC family protein [Lentisphaeria bacterium]|nr:VOC family protein [Lentisphaeria bacterium]
MIRQIAHICVHATDLEAAERFFVQGLGLGIRFRFLRDGQTVGFYLDVGRGTYIEVFRRDAAVPGAAPIAHVCLEVDDIHACTVDLQARGIATSEVKLGADRSWQSWITGPDGLRVELHQYNADSAQRTGQDCVLNR